MSMSPEDLFEACLERRQAGEDVEEILRQHPELADEIRGLLAVASEVQRMAVAPATGVGLVKAMARQAANQPGARPVGLPRRVLRFTGRWVMRAAVVLFAFVLVGWTTNTVSVGALPGDALYPLKLFTEKAYFFLSVNDESRAEWRILFSDRRLREAVLQHQRSGGLDRELLAAMIEEARLAVDSSAALPEDHRVCFVSRLSSLAEHQKRQLERLRDSAAAEDREALDSYINMCGACCNWMREVPRPTEQEEAPPSGERWRQWRGNCPMDGCGCR